MSKWMVIACAGFACALFWQPLILNSQDEDLTLTSGRNDTDLPVRRPLTEDEMVEQLQQELIQEFDADTSLDEGASIHPKLMKTVKDNTVGVRFEERQAYLCTLRLAHDVPLRRLERFAAEMRAERRESTPSYQQRRLEDFPQFVDLFTRPDYYRGRPVTLHGIMRKVTKFDVGENSLDIGQVYEGWVYTPDSQGNPAVVVFTSKDERLPVKGDIQEEVEFTGYFFKMYGYDAHDTARKAPLILAGDVVCIPHPEHHVYRQLGIEWYAVATLAFLVGWYLVWQMTRQEMRPRPLPKVEPDFKHFPPLDHPAPDPFLPRSIVETEDS